jgi:hypothetical protein
LAVERVESWVVLRADELAVKMAVEMVAERETKMVG